jgi:hypothetical protein
LLPCFLADHRQCGLYLLTIGLIEYDHEFQAGAATRLPVPVIAAHALLAIIGLGSAMASSLPSRSCSSC